MNIIQALQDPELLGALPAFRDLSTWRPWLAFLRAVYGLPMDATDLELFRRHTGRQTPRPGGYPEACQIGGRQSGRTTIAAAVTSFESMTARERGTFGLSIAQDFRGSQRALFGYIREMFRASPVFAREVVKETADTIELANGTTIAVYPCRPSATRGIRARVVVCDELAFFVSGEGNAVDTEMLRAVRPALATTRGKLLILSSPYGQSGALWDLHRQHFGQADSPCLVWQASAPEMNPTLPLDYLQRMERDDPEAFRSEVLGEFRAGIATLLDPAALDACVVTGRRELAPASEVHYRAFVDPSGGRSDAYAVCVGHRAGAAIVVDCLRAWKSPFNPEGVTAEAAALLASYRIHEVTGDRFGGEWPREAMRKHGVTYRIAADDRSALYLALLPVVNAGAVEVLDLPDLLRELRGLERRRGPSGKDRVDHRAGSHDDRANALAGLVAMLPARSHTVPDISESFMSGPTAQQADDTKTTEGAVADPGGFISDTQRRGKRDRFFLPGAPRGSKVGAEQDDPAPALSRSGRKLPDDWRG